MGKPGVKKKKTHKENVHREKPGSQTPTATPSPRWKVRWPPELPTPKYGGKGNILHGKPLNDPVYPTIKVPESLKARFPITWRNGGRALLCFALASIEGLRHIWTSKDGLLWQKEGYCSSRCGMNCGKSLWRCLCAWRASGAGFHEHIIRMDDIINKPKGPNLEHSNKSIGRGCEARRNSTTSVAMAWDTNHLKYVLVDENDTAYEKDRIRFPISTHEFDPGSINN